MPQYPTESDISQPQAIERTSDDAHVQRVMQSPVYILLSGDVHVKAFIQKELLPLRVLAAVSEAHWLNLLISEYVQALDAQTMTLPQVLAKQPRWDISVRHYEALREPEIRQLIHTGIFTFDRFTRLNGRQVDALCASAGLRTQLLKRQITAPYFLRHSPSQLAEFVAALDVPKAAL